MAAGSQQDPQSCRSRLVENKKLLLSHTAVPILKGRRIFRFTDSLS